VFSRTSDKRFSKKKAFKMFTTSKVIYFCVVSYNIKIDKVKKNSKAFELYLYVIKQYSVENIGALKYVYLKFPEEAVALYKIINRYQIQDPQDYSMSYIYSVIKDILWSALNERQLDTIYTYISLLSVLTELLFSSLNTG
jgi:hypothetical protein